jgi:hypothetical protein
MSAFNDRRHKVVDRLREKGANYTNKHNRRLQSPPRSRGTYGENIVKSIPEDGVAAPYELSEDNGVYTNEERAMSPNSGYRGRITAAHMGFSAPTSSRGGFTLNNSPKSIATKEFSDLDSDDSIQLTPTGKVWMKDDEGEEENADHFGTRYYSSSTPKSSYAQSSDVQSSSHPTPNRTPEKQSQQHQQDRYHQSPLFNNVSVPRQVAGKPMPDYVDTDKMRMENALGYGTNARGGGSKVNYPKIRTKAPTAAPTAMPQDYRDLSRASSAMSTISNANTASSAGASTVKDDQQVDFVHIQGQGTKAYSKVPRTPAYRAPKKTQTPTYSTTAKESELNNWNSTLRRGVPATKKEAIRIDDRTKSPSKFKVKEAPLVEFVMTKDGMKAIPKSVPAAPPQYSESYVPFSSEDGYGAEQLSETRSRSSTASRRNSLSLSAAGSRRPSIDDIIARATLSTAQAPVSRSSFGERSSGEGETLRDNRAVHVNYNDKIMPTREIPRDTIHDYDTDDIGVAQARVRVTEPQAGAPKSPPEHDSCTSSPNFGVSPIDSPCGISTPPIDSPRTGDSLRIDINMYLSGESSEFLSPKSFANDEPDFNDNPMVQPEEVKASGSNRKSAGAQMAEQIINRGGSKLTSNALSRNKKKSLNDNFRMTSNVMSQTTHTHREPSEPMKKVSSFRTQEVPEGLTVDPSSLLPSATRRDSAFLAKTMGLQDAHFNYSDVQIKPTHEIPRDSPAETKRASDEDRDERKDMYKYDQRYSIHFSKDGKDGIKPGCDDQHTSPIQLDRELSYPHTLVQTQTPPAGVHFEQKQRTKAKQQPKSIRDFLAERSIPGNPQNRTHTRAGVPLSTLLGKTHAGSDGANAQIAAYL